MKKLRRLWIDYEIRSENSDVTECGASELARDPTTDIIVFGYKIYNEPTRIWYPEHGDSFPRDLQDALADRELLRVAHNAFFEQMISMYVLTKYVPKSNPRLRQHLSDFDPRWWRCTAAKARYHSLPGNLENALKALKAPIEKDMEGRRLSIMMAKPRPAYKRDPAFNLKWYDDRPRLERLGKYNIGDVEGEHLIDHELPDLPEYEQEVWFMDQEINFRGMRVDRDSCAKALRMYSDEMRDLNNEIKELSHGDITACTQRERFLGFLQEEGLVITDLQKATVDSFLKRDDLTGRQRRALEIRRDSSSTSIGKYQAFLDRSASDGRVRDLLVYHGASPTGRWSGAGVQPQNFPRGIFYDHENKETKEVELSAEEEQRLAIAEIQDESRDGLKIGWGSFTEALASCLRGMIQASEGQTLHGADYAAIEARVLMWLAGDDRAIRAFVSGEDMYKLIAARIYGVPVEKVTKTQREIGKRAFLGCGYGMGATKFLATCHQYGATDVTPELAKRAVAAYREVHAKVPALWKWVERAAIYAVENPTKIVKGFGLKWFMSDCRRFLLCELPSGRLMHHPYPRVKFGPTPWGEPRAELRYWGVDSETKQWREEHTYGGKIVENLCQAIARDLMVNGMFRARDAGYSILLTVHDELVSEIKKGSVEQFEKLVTHLPPWAKGLPLKAEGWSGERYRK